MQDGGTSPPGNSLHEAARLKALSDVTTIFMSLAHHAANVRRHVGIRRPRPGARDGILSLSGRRENPPP
jgi:hypothetical protein